jgi:hypothetical protein
MYRWKDFAHDALRQRWAIAGVADMWMTDQTPVVDSVYTFARPLETDQTKRLVHSWTPEVFETFYYGMPRDLWMEINGLDERADKWRTLPYDHFVNQAKAADIRLRVDARNCIDILNHRLWSPSELWNSMYKFGRPDEMAAAHPAPEVNAQSINGFVLWQHWAKVEGKTSHHHGVTGPCGY